MIRAEQLLAILVLEAALSYPQWLHRRLPHPVVWAGKLIQRLDGWWNRGSPVRQRIGGIAVAAALTVIAGGIGLLLEHLLTGQIGAVAIVLIATIGLAQRSLHDHVRAVAIPLAAGQTGQARTALAMIVGRDTEALDEQGIASAATESLAESFCDGVVAPAFWFLIGGLPGLFLFKAISTADSLIGHLDDKYRHFGWASARLDDLLNLIPARIAGGLLCLAGGGWQIMLRDAGRHLSPNAGWPEAAMAGALGRQLGGGAYYDGEWIARAELGDGPGPAASDLARALGLYRRACLLLWLITGALIWAL